MNHAESWFRRWAEILSSEMVWGGKSWDQVELAKVGVGFLIDGLEADW